MAYDPDGLCCAIREWFADRLEVMPCDEDLELHGDLTMAAHAVGAVLDVHAPIDPYPSARACGLQPGTKLCRGCMKLGGVIAPCPTVRAIAQRLGITCVGTRR